MSLFKFIITSDNKLSLSPLKHKQDSYPQRVNIIGDYLEEQRYKKRMTKLETAKELGFNNINKTIRTISEIEENSKIFQEYNKKLIVIYNIDENRFNKIKQTHEDKLEEMKERANGIKLAFYLSLIEKLPFLYLNYEKIIENDHYYFCPVPYAYLSSAFIGRARNKLYLGELLMLWKKDSWKTECPECRGTVYITNVGGSPLSGRGSGCGMCNHCKKYIYGITPFSKYFRQVMELPVRKMPKSLSFISFETLLKEF